MNKELTEKRARFIEEYLRDYNGTQAAIRAGYAPESAGVEACRLLKNANVRKRLEKRKKQLLDAISEDQFRTMRELSRVAHLDIRKLYDEQGQLKPVSEWDDESAAAVAGVETVRRQSPEERDEEGNPVWETVMKVKTYDKVKALELIGRHQSLFNDSLTLKPGDETGVIYLPAKVPVGAPVELEAGKE